MVGFSRIMAPICRGPKMAGVGGIQKPVGRKNGAKGVRTWCG